MSLSAALLVKEIDQINRNGQLDLELTVMIELSCHAIAAKPIMLSI